MDLSQDAIGAVAHVWSLKGSTPEEVEKIESFKTWCADLTSLLSRIDEAEMRLGEVKAELAFALNGVPPSKAILEKAEKLFNFNFSFNPLAESEAKPYQVEDVTALLKALRNDRSTKQNVRYIGDLVSRVPGEF
jgi:hypothetical protein